VALTFYEISNRVLTHTSTLTFACVNTFTLIVSSFPPYLISTTICLYGISYNLIRKACSQHTHTFTLLRQVQHTQCHGEYLSRNSLFRLFGETRSALIFILHSQCGVNFFAHMNVSRLLAHLHNVKIVIALSTQLVRFLRGTSLSEVVFASKSSFYPAIH